MKQRVSLLDQVEPMLHQRLLCFWPACRGHQKVTTAEGGTRFLTLRHIHLKDLISILTSTRMFLRMRNHLVAVPHAQELVILSESKVTGSSVELRITTPVCSGGGLLYLVVEEVRR